MNRLPLFAPAALTVLALGCLSMGLARADTVADTIVRHDSELNRLLMRHDPKAAAFYDDEFLLTTSSGRTKTKADLLKEVADDGLRLDVNETAGVTVRARGTTAVLTGILRQRGEYRGKAFDNYLHVTDTWVEDNGEWRLLAGHATLIVPTSGK